MSPEALAFFVFSAGMLVLMGIGMNMALALVLTGAAMAWVLGFWDTQLLAQNLVAGIDSFPLLAVPFFILAGELMNSGGISKRIIDMAQAWVGHIRGGLGYVAIGAAVLMASMSGSPAGSSILRSTHFHATTRPTPMISPGTMPERNRDEIEVLVVTP